MAKVYLFGGESNKTVYQARACDLEEGTLDFGNMFPSGRISESKVVLPFLERYYLNEMCFERFDMNLRAIDLHFFIVGSTERSELDQINQKLIRYANRGVRITASRVRVV